MHILYEDLELHRYENDPRYLPRLVEYLKEKYAAQPPDVVVSGGPLRKFLEENAPFMFPGVPVVYWEDASVAVQAIPGADFDDSEREGFAKSVDVIFKTRPATRKVYVVLGSWPEEHALRSNIEEIIRQYAGKAEFVFLGDLSHSRMLDRVRNAEKNSAVLFVRWGRDGDGMLHKPGEAIREVCRVSGAPVYCVVGMDLGLGVVGGYVFNFELFGRKLAEQALAFIEGRQYVDSLATAEYAFDWRQLKRWSIPEKNLPDGSRVLFRESSVWDDHKGLILTALGVMLLESVLVGALVVNRARRMRVENELKVLNESLEEEVSRRTREIHEANAELTSAKAKLEDMNASLDQASRTDSLTGLNNRRHLEKVFEQEQARSSRMDEPYSVIMCDIDYFKRVNDQYGHLTGDDLLMQLARDLEKAVRPYDTLARWGGEEFLLFLPGTGTDPARTIAERIREDVAGKVFSCAGSSLRITLTLGVASAKPGESVDEVLKRADDALYEGKRSGRDRVITA